jgi:hypothetical protein
MDTARVAVGVAWVLGALWMVWVVFWMVAVLLRLGDIRRGVEELLDQREK